MAGSQETSVAPQIHIIHTSIDAPSQILDLETEIGKAKAAINQILSSVQIIKDRAQNNQTQFGDQAQLANLQREFLQQASILKTLEKQLEQHTSSIDSDFEKEFLSLMGKETVVAPAFANLITSVPATTQALEEKSPAVQSQAELATPQAQLNKSKPVLERIGKKGSFLLEYDGTISVEKAITQGAHNILKNRADKGLAEFVDYVELLQPLIKGRHVYIKYVSYLDTKMLAQLAQDNGYVFEERPTIMGPKGSKHGYRYSKSGAETPPPAKPKSPAQQTRTFESTPTSAVKKTKSQQEVRSEVRKTGQPPSSHHKAPEQVLQTQTASEKKPVVISSEYRDIKVSMLIRQAYEEYEEIFKTIFALDAGEVSAARALTLLIKVQIPELPINTIKYYEIGREDKGRWVFTAPEFIMVYLLLRNRYKIDNSVATAWSQVKDELNEEIVAGIQATN